jgi:hypothetical protein
MFTAAWIAAAIEHCARGSACRFGGARARAPSVSSGGGITASGAAPRLDFRRLPWPRPNHTMSRLGWPSKG